MAISVNHSKFEAFIKNYWQYFRELEDEILATRRYVDFQSDNYGTFSVEYLKLYQAICSEIDVIGKAMAEEVDSNFKPDEKQNNIYKWWLVIQNDISFPVWDEEKLEWDISTNLRDAEVQFVNDEQVIPWSLFETEIRPDKNGVNRTELVKGCSIPNWWSGYNKVKHQRTSKVSKKSDKTNYSKANLGNVIHSIAGLYVLEKSYMHAVGTKNDIEAFADHSRLFERVGFATSEDIDRILDFGETV